MKKQRLDVVLTEKGWVKSRQRAQALIMAGKVLVNDIPVDKAGAMVSADDDITLKGEDIAYVSRGGLKLEAALEAFELNVSGWICLDAGASTGGFTDCLLQKGAALVYAVDVGYGQLAWKLRQDPRVVVYERTNIRYLESLPQQVHFVVIDVSFISLQIVVSAILKFLKKGGAIVALIKPQFEVGKGKVGKGGVVRDPGLHEEVIEKLTVFFKDIGLSPIMTTPSPILGPKGNKEFMILLKY